MSDIFAISFYKKPDYSRYNPDYDLMIQYNFNKGLPVPSQMKYTESIYENLRNGMREVVDGYLRSCFLTRMRIMRAMLAAMPRLPSTKMTVASVSPPGGHWNPLELLVMFPGDPLPQRRFAPIIATADPEQNRGQSKTRITKGITVKVFHVRA